MATIKCPGSGDAPAEWLPRDMPEDDDRPSPRHPPEPLTYLRDLAPIEIRGEGDPE